MKQRIFFSTVKMALDTVREHKMRSFLTVLGVIIGSGTIIAVGSIIAGLDTSISGIFEGMGGNSALAFKVPPLSGHLTPEELNRKPLTHEDGVAIEERCPDVVRVSPLLFPPGIFQGPQLDRVRYKGNDMYSLIVRGTDESFTSSGNSGAMVQGRFFTDEENRHRMPVVVLGLAVTKGIMAGEDPIGKWVNLDGSEFQVVGVMDKPANSFPGQDYRWALLPYFTMQKVFPMAKENLLIIQSKPGRLDEAIDEARVVLRIQRHVPFNKPDNFAISTGEQMVENFHQVTGMVALVMVVLSSIGLLVGGIGVMNIMLVSVTERTREIGVRKAIGAQANRYHSAVPDRGRGAHGHWRPHRHDSGMAGFADRAADLPVPADCRAVVGRRAGSGRIRGRGPVLRHLAGEQSRPPRPGGSAAIRVESATRAATANA